MNRFVLFSAALLFSQIATCDEYRLQERVAAIEDEIESMKNPPSYTEPFSFRSSSGVFVNKGEFLWLKTYTRTLPYAALASLQPSIFGGTLFNNDHLLYVYFPSSPGFRIGMGYIFDFAKWEFDVLWTRLYTYGTSSATSDGANSALQFLQASPFVNLNPEAPMSVSAQAKIKLNLVDIEMGRVFWPSSHISLRPIFGARFAGITHSMDVIYNGVDFTPVAVEQNVYLRRKIRGGGLRMGGDFRLLILGGWEIYSNGFVSMLLSKQKESSTDTATNFTDTMTISNYDNIRRLITNLQLGAGLKWGSYLWSKHTYLSLQAGYETSTWYNYNQMTTYFPTTVAVNLIDSDLDMAGWVFSAKLLY